MYYVKQRNVKSIPPFCQPVCHSSVLFYSLQRSIDLFQLWERDRRQAISNGRKRDEHIVARAHGWNLHGDGSRVGQLNMSSRQQKSNNLKTNCLSPSCHCRVTFLFLVQRLLFCAKSNAFQATVGPRFVNDSFIFIFCRGRILRKKKLDDATAETRTLLLCRRVYLRRINQCKSPVLPQLKEECLYTHPLHQFCRI